MEAYSVLMESLKDCLDPKQNGKSEENIEEDEDQRVYSR